MSAQPQQERIERAGRFGGIARIAVAVPAGLRGLTARAGRGRAAGPAPAEQGPGREAESAGGLEILLGAGREAPEPVPGAGFEPEQWPETESESETEPEPERRVLLPAELRRQTGRIAPATVFSVIGSAMAAFSLAKLLDDWIAPFTSDLALFLIWYALFVGLYAVIVSVTESALAVRDRLAWVLTWSAAVLVVFMMGEVIIYPVVNGIPALRHLNNLTHDMSGTGPLSPITQGGLLHAVVGTIEQITITMAITMPLGILTGLFMNELPGRLANLVRTVAAAATALPSVVAGLFIYGLMIIEVGLPESGFAAGLALSIMTLPIIIRASDVVFRLVPAGLKEASYALGASRWRTALQVTLPTARSGLATAVILGAARGIGETSPVLLTAGYNTAMNANPFYGPQTSLPLATFKLVTSGEPNLVSRGYAAAVLLLVLVFVLFVVARVIGGRPPGQLSRGQRRRRAVASVQLVRRYEERAARLPEADEAAEGAEAAAAVEPEQDVTEPGGAEPSMEEGN